MASTSGEYLGRNGHIAFVRFDETGEHPVTFITHRSGTHDRGLSLPWLAFWPTWSPDGSELLVTDFEPVSGFDQPSRILIHRKRSFSTSPGSLAKRILLPSGSQEANPLSCEFGNPQRVIR
jgi:hypothetical protein